MRDAGASDSEVIITVTDDDEVNIFAALLANALGCKRPMAIVNNTNYRNLSKKLDLDVLIHPGNITTSAILQYVRRGKVKEVHDFGNDRGEIMEIEILPTTKFADKQIIDLDMPDMSMPDDFEPGMPETISIGVSECMFQDMDMGEMSMQEVMVEVEIVQ